MITPKVLLVQDWAQWRQAKLVLDVPGLTFVRGRNYDDVGNPNRVGKSTLFNAASALLFGEHQLSVRKRSLKALTGDTTRIALRFDNGKHDVLANLKGSNLHISIDGRKIEAHKKAGEREELEAQYSISQELHYATIHINGIASNPLIRGTSSARCQFLERAFNLDRWSPLHSKVGDTLKHMNAADKELEEVRLVLSDLGETTDTKNLKHRVGILEKKQSRVAKWLEQALIIQGRIEALPEKPKLKTDELENMLVGVNKRIHEVSRQEAAVALWQRYVEERRELLTNLRSAKAEQSKSPLPTVEKLQSRLSLVEKQLSGSQHIRSENSDVMKTWLRLASSLARNHGIPWSSLDQLHGLAEGWVQNWHDGQTSCPVCGGKLKMRVDGPTLKKLAEVQRQITGRVFDPTEVEKTEKLRNFKLKLKGLIRASEDDARAQTEVAAIRKKLDRLVKPKKVTDHGDLKRLVQRRDEINAQLDAAKQYARVRIPAGATAETLGVRISSARKIAGKIADLLESGREQLHRAEEDFKKQTELTEKLHRLEDEVSLRPVYKAMHMAYSPNGMRLWLLQELIEAIITDLNRQSRSLRDSHEYGYKLSRNRDLVFTASNIRGTYDIRYLSGAESSMFVLNLLTVLLPMLPSSRRSNLLVLDEVDANCSNRSREIIASEYLPRLKKCCGSVFVITPMMARDFHIGGANELLITKKAGISSLGGSNG
jgi:hypothetical protein